MKPLDVLLVGAGPARNPHIVLACKAAGRSASRPSLGWLHTFHPDLYQFALRTRYKHLVKQVPRGRGVKFPVAEARTSAQRIQIPPEVKIVLFLGSRVANAFRVPINLFEGIRMPLMDKGEVLRTYQGFSFPYLSGSFWWDKSHNRERAQKFLEQIGRMPWK